MVLSGPSARASPYRATSGSYAPNHTERTAEGSTCDRRGRTLSPVPYIPRIRYGRETRGPEPFRRYECSKARRADRRPGVEVVLVGLTCDPGIGPDPSTLSDRVSGSCDELD